MVRSAVTRAGLNLGLGEFVIFKINYLNLACPHTKCMEPTGVTRRKKYMFALVRGSEIQDPRSLAGMSSACCIDIRTGHQGPQKFSIQTADFSSLTLF